MTRTERLARIEDLLGKDGSPKAAELMAKHLPWGSVNRGDWTPEEWDAAVELTEQELAAPRKSLADYLHELGW
jgi:hypothetical protein